jgi:hypothetical protein
MMTIKELGLVLPHPSVCLSVFAALTKYRVVKIACFSSEVVLQTMKHTIIYLGSGPSLEVIALRLVI